MDGEFGFQKRERGTLVSPQQFIVHYEGEHILPEDLTTLVLKQRSMEEQARLYLHLRAVAAGLTVTGREMRSVWNIENFEEAAPTPESLEFKRELDFLYKAIDELYGLGFSTTEVRCVRKVSVQKPLFLTGVLDVDFRPLNYMLREANRFWFIDRSPKENSQRNSTGFNEYAISLNKSSLDELLAVSDGTVYALEKIPMHLVTTPGELREFLNKHCLSLKEYALGKGEYWD